MSSAKELTDVGKSMGLDGEDLLKKEWERGQRSEVDVSRAKWNRFPYITNVNEDPQLSGVIKHAVCKECTIIGRSGTGDGAIEIRGLGIQMTHAEVVTDGTTTLINPYNDKSLVIVNGMKVREKKQLHHGDRIKLGSTSMFLYIGYPKERRSTDSGQFATYDFDFCMTELAEHEGVSVDIQTPKDSDSSQDMSNMMLFQDFVDLMPKISEANAISEEMKRNVKFEPVIKSESSHDPKGKATGKEVIIKVTNTVSKKVWIWPKVKFINRKDLLDELYLRHLDGESVILTRDKDPFWDPVEDIFLGSCHVILQSIAYCAEIDEHFTVHNYHGKEEAVIHVQLLPCDDRGKLIEGDFILEPKDLLGKSLSFYCQLPQCMSVRWVNEDHSRGVYCKFNLHNQKPAKTQEVWHKSYVEFGYKHKFTYKTVAKELLNYFHTHSLVLELWGQQVSEDEQLHRSIGHADMETAIKDGAEPDVLMQLKKMEDETERLTNECELLRKDNFRLKQSAMTSDDKIKLLEMRREQSNLQRQGSRDRKLSTERKPSSERLKMPTRSAENDKTSTAGGLDVDFAKALRNFFRDVRGVQQGLQDMKDYVITTKDSSTIINGHKNTFEACEKKVTETDGKLTECLLALKRSAAVALRKSRPSTETVSKT